jgi:four helix bundle protein
MSDSYRDLIAWQTAMALATEVYRLTRNFPRDEMFGLTRQVRDAAASVPSNIAEGKGRQTKKDYLQFLYRARVSESSRGRSSTCRNRSAQVPLKS